METQPAWTHPPSRPRLADGFVDVWRADLAACGEGVSESLTADERQRAARFFREADQDRWARARGVLRSLLALYLESEPSSLDFVTQAHGKPELDPPSSLRFNVSHSGDVALYAFAAGREVGIDVESRTRPVDVVRLARQNMGEETARRLAELEPADRRREFLVAWTRHEAMLKCRGIGLEGEVPDDAPPVWASTLVLGDDTAGAVAAEGDAAPTLRLWLWSSSVSGEWRDGPRPVTPSTQEVASSASPDLA
jgi:4'-phosphopantetheinyl transferase